MKIKITTTRKPWLAGKPQPVGALVDVDDDTAAIMIDRGWAEGSRGRKKKDAGDADE